MLPHTRAVFEALQREEGVDMPVTGERGQAAHGDDKIYQLALRKKYQTNLLRKMLADAGYGDLSKMAAIRRENIHDDEGDL